MLAVLMDSPIAWAALAALTIFSTGFAVYVWIAGKSRKQFSVSCKTNEIITSGKYNIEKLDIKYNGENISSLSSSKFFVWNSGNTIIDYADMVPSRPLCIRNTGDAVILDARILRCSEETNNFTITKVTYNNMELSFDYIDHGEGLVVQILHTGSARDLELDCKIKGGKDICDRSDVKRKKEESKSQTFWDVFQNMLPAVLSFSLAIFSTYLASIICNAIEEALWIEAFVSIAMLLIGFVIGLVIGIVVPKKINERLHRTIPNSLIKNK